MCFVLRNYRRELKLKMNAAEAVEWLSIPEEERSSTLAGVEKKLSAAPVKTNDP